MQHFKYLSILVVAGMLGACNQTLLPTADESALSVDDAATPGRLTQDAVCFMRNLGQQDEMRKSCKPGQKIVFLPEQWGNEQLPIIFAASHCDLRYSVALTHGGVTCIYIPIKEDEPEEESEEESGTSG